MSRAKKPVFLIQSTLILLAATLASCGVGSAIIHQVEDSKTMRQEAQARKAIARKIAEMQEVPYRELFALYNEIPHDDPRGPYTAPGDRFGFVIPDHPPFLGRIEFPTDPVCQLRENVNLSWCTMPRDLDGDREIDGFDHAENYTLLPIRIAVTWTSPRGRQTVDQIIFLAQGRR